MFPRGINTHVIARQLSGNGIRGASNPQAHPHDPLSDQEIARRSTLPSILDLEHLTGGYHSAIPFADPIVHRTAYKHGTPRHSLFPPVPPIPEGETYKGDAKLMTPGAHQKLGRMSTATARYSLSPEKKHKARNSDSIPSSEDDRSDSRLRGAMPVQVAAGAVSKWRQQVVVRFYLTWRPFISAGLCLICALLMTIALQNSSNKINAVVKVQQGTFNISAAGPQAAGLGVNGWCQLGGSE